LGYTLFSRNRVVLLPSTHQFLLECPSISLAATQRFYGWKFRLLVLQFRIGNAIGSSGILFTIQMSSSNRRPPKRIEASLEFVLQFTFSKKIGSRDRGNKFVIAAGVPCRVFLLI
jgi:hypothetical protein